MADARSLTYQVHADTSDAVKSLDELESKFGSVDDATDDIEIGARQCSDAISNMGAAASEAADEVNHSASGIKGNFNDAGTSISSLFSKKVSDAVSSAQKKFVGFRNDVTKGAKQIGNSFLHPIDTIKNKLVSALGGAGDEFDETGEKAEESSEEVEKFGDEGEDAGDRVKDAIKGALGAFLGIEAIKTAASAIKDFSASAITAASGAENTAAKFENLFSGTDVTDWAENYADAVHRNETEVQSFLVSNNALLRNFGIIGDGANDLSKIMTSLAYDFGNAFSMDDAEALTALQSGIQGSTDALAEYGISLDDATLQAEAQRMGLSGNIDEMEEAQLAQVRLSAVISQASKIQKAAANDQDGLTNSTKNLKGIWSEFMEDAGNEFTPTIEAFFDTIVDIWPTVEPMLLNLVSILSDGLSLAMPVIIELGQVLLPILANVLGTVFQAATPLITVFTTLAQTVLPPVTEILGMLAETLLPPIAEILTTVVSLLTPFFPLLKSLAEAVLPPIAELLGIISPILEALEPVLSAVASVLQAIVDILDSLIGWLVDGVGAVIDFFSNLFGGAKDSKEEVEELSGAVNDLGDATDVDNEINVDTSAAQDEIIATKDISDLNLQLMGVEAESTYANMAISAEEAWTRMTSAAEEGAQAIVKSFEKIAAAAAGVNGADISVSGVSMPSNASGTDNFEGGWTRINEEGGEVAFLPRGTAIIPADKSAQLVAGSGGGGGAFAPSLNITVQGSADQATVDEIMRQAEAMFQRLYKEQREAEYDQMIVKNGYAS